jgi:type VI secretion system protein VasJ
MELNFQTYQEQILKPISSDEPCGSDPKYETLYEGIRAEVAKTSGIGHGAPDWEKVESDSIQLLVETAKEINLMAYLVSAMTINHDLDGMTEGFRCFSRFLKTYWPTMFPPLKKIKIRARAVAWLSDRVMEQSDIFQIKDRPKLVQALEAVKELKDAVYEYFSDPPTKFSGLRNAIEDQLATLPEEKPEPDIVAITPETAGPSPETPPPAPAPAPSGGQAPQFSLPSSTDLSALSDPLTHLAGDLFESDPTQTLSYTLNREIAWMDFKTPNSQGGGATMVPAPVPELQESLKIMNSKANWTDLLVRCESILIRWPFWMDLQYYASQAAKGLGKDYERALAIIEFYASGLTTRFPDLLKLKFDDGTPFTNPATKKWVSDLAASSGSGGSAPAPEELFAAALA